MVLFNVNLYFVILWPELTALPWKLLLLRSESCGYRTANTAPKEISFQNSQLARSLRRRSRCCRWSLWVAIKIVFNLYQIPWFRTFGILAFLRRSVREGMRDLLWRSLAWVLALFKEKYNQCKKNLICHRTVVNFIQLKRSFERLESRLLFTICKLSLQRVT